MWTTGGGYNKYDRVACGFHVDENNRVWINQNFGAPYQDFGFACGGTHQTKPQATLVPDCMVTEIFRNYVKMTEWGEPEI